VNTNLKRRALLGTAAALALGPGLVRAQEVTLTILSHKVHETVSRGLTPGTVGGDIAGEWAKKKGVKLNWITGNIEPIHDRLFRELSLRETSIDLAFVINKFETPKISTLLEPLDDWQKKAPIEDFAGIPANLLVAFARKMTYTRADGTRVNGLIANSGDEHLAVLTILNMYGAELIDKDQKVKANSPQMIKGLKVLAELYKEGVLPTNYATISIDDVIGAMQQGRAAMGVDPFARYTVYNNPKASKYPGQIEVVALPADSGLGRTDTSMTEIWSMAIPKNSKQKELAWDLIRELSSKENTVKIALNGNGPVRAAAYDDERLKKQLAYTVEESKAIQHALVVPSGFNASLEALTIFKEESQAAVLGRKTPEQAAAAMQSRIEPLVK
jgi:multiple sugar transport system substrate-binding protein